MSLTTQQKSAIISDHRRSDDDTGSTEVQIAILSKRISDLTEHLKTHKLDSPAVSVGKVLEIEGERFKGAPEADALLTREYRKPYVVPDSV